MLYAIKCIRTIGFFNVGYVAAVGGYACSYTEEVGVFILGGFFLVTICLY